MRTSLALQSLPLALALACGDDAGPTTGSGGSAGAPSSGSASGGAANGGSVTGAGGTSGGATGGSASGAGTSAGGTPAGGAGAGQAGASSGAAGASGSAGTAGAAGGSGGSGGGTGAGCTRELLKATVDAYFTALTAHTPSTLPLADSVKHTENGKVSKAGDEGLWKTAGARKYAHSAFDTELCMSASQAVVADGSKDVPMALRLKLQNQKITEIEMIVARSGDYPALTANPAALAALDATVKWELAPPAAQRATKQQLTGWMDKYFKQFPSGVCNTTPECKRIENGGGNFVCGQGASCASGAGSGQAVLDSRLIFADVESGIGVGFTIFTGGYIDMHMFKMYDGKVHAVSAILANGEDSGWE